MMESNDLELASAKTAALVLKGPYKRDIIDIRVIGERIHLSNSLEYLGVVLGNRGFGRHVQHVRNKANKKVLGLNVGGPTATRRRLYWEVVASVLLFAVPVWYDTLRVQRHLQIFESLQRRKLLRVVSAYRTVYKEAAWVVSGVLTFEFLARERKEAWGQNETLAQK